MLSRYCCPFFLTQRCTLEHSSRPVNEGRSTGGIFVWWLFFFVSVLGGSDFLSGAFAVRVSRAFAFSAVPAAALQATANQLIRRDEGGLNAEVSGDGRRQSTLLPPNSHQEGAHLSLGYWTAEAELLGESEVDAYTVVDSVENAAMYFTPPQLKSVSQLIKTTRREKLVEDEDRFRDHRFKSFTAELGDFAQARFRPFESRRAAALHFKSSSGKHRLNHKPQEKVPLKVDGHQGGKDFTLARLQLLEAVPGRFASKVSVLVAKSKLQWGSKAAPLTCLGKRCANDVGKIQSLKTPADFARAGQREVEGSHGLLQGFVTEVEGPVADTELEKELRWELHIWSYLPACRALELAEKEHILIPSNLLRHEKGAVSFDTEELAHQRRQEFVATKGPVEENSTSDPIQGHEPGGFTSKAMNVVGEREQTWTDRISEKVYNVFTYYPKGYRDTISSSLIPSDQITESWYRTATTEFLLTISAQMVLAVANLNSYGLVHTHIRPSSFVLDLDGVVLLSDLHRAVAVGETMDCLADRVRGINDLTASPEESACMYKHASNFEEFQDRREFVAGPMRADFPVDSWRLGVILYRLWCREPAHDRRSEHEFHLRHLSVSEAGKSVAVDAYLEENRLPMVYCRKDIPSSLQRLIRQLLVAEPTFRATAADAVKKNSLFHHLVHQRKQAAEQDGSDARQRLVLE